MYLTQIINLLNTTGIAYEQKSYSTGYERHTSPVHRRLSVIIYCWRAKRERRDEYLAKYGMVDDCHRRFGTNAGVKYAKNRSEPWGDYIHHADY